MVDVYALFKMNFFINNYSFLKLMTTHLVWSEVSRPYFLGG